MPESSAPRYANYTMYQERDAREPLAVRPAELRQIVADLPRPIVLCNGAFDLLHAGHMRMLFAARGYAATLIVALDTDAKVRREKGALRPIQSELERATALRYMPIDLIVEIKDENDFRRALRALSPDLRVQSDEYRRKPSRYPDIPKLFVRNGRIHTSDLVTRIERRLAL